jgi:hypothetical protein
VFRSPFYAGAHVAYLELGEDALRSIVAETLAVLGRARPIDRERARLRVLPHFAEGRRHE